MTKNRARVLLAFLAAAPLLTCSLPPYQEGLSLGLETARKMKELGADQVTVGPLRVWDFDFRDRRFYFIPNKGSATEELKSGFIAVADERSFGLSYVNHVTPDIFEVHGGWGIEITNADSHRLNFRAETIKGGPFLSLIRFDARDYKNNEYFLIEWNTASYWISDHVVIHLRSFINEDSATFGGDLNKLPTIIGSSIWPRPSFDGYDDQVFFCRFDGNGRYAELRYRTDPAGGLSSGAVIRDDIEFWFPDEFENAFYYRNANTDVSYLSYYSKVQRKYKNYSWGPGPALLNPLINMDRRIDAVLTTGQLLSFENNRCYVYDANGEKEYDFLLGGLHYCYEIDLFGTGRFYAIFALPGWLKQRDQDDELYFYVYALPTDLLDQLQ
jgi:hypothetical protein